MAVLNVLDLYPRAIASFRSSAPAGVAMVMCLMIVASAGCAAKEERRLAGDTRAQSRAEAAFDAGADKPPSPDTMYGLARILLAQGRTMESMTLLRNTTGQYPNYLPAYNALAEAHLRLGQTDEAIEVLTEGLRRAPNDPVLLNNLGMTLFLERRYEEALPHFERAAAVRPEDATYRANQAATLGMLGRADEARAVYRQFLSPADVGANIQVLERARRSSAAGPVPEDNSPPQLIPETHARPEAARVSPAE